MARIHLSIDNSIFTALSNAAAAENITVNALLVNLLNKLYGQSSTPFNYSYAVTVLEREALNMPIGCEFALADLPSFNDIAVVQANLQPSTIRSTIGKIFNARVRDNKIGGIERAKKPDGVSLKFYNGAALYLRTPKGAENDDKS